jgi:undecaprenyl-diphosphatase
MPIDIIQKKCIPLQAGRLHIILLFFLFIQAPAQNLDIRILRSINSPSILRSDNFFRAASTLDFPIVVITPAILISTGLITGNKKKINSSIEIAASAVICFGITEGIKYSVNRTRPFKTYPDIRNKTKKAVTDPGFPSGHTSAIFNTATELALNYPKWYIIIPGYLAAGTIAYSRMYLGVHYPTDVLAGAIIGAGTAYLTHVISKKLWHN